MTETKLEKKTLKEWRKILGLTQYDLDELAGLYRGRTSEIERGVRPIYGIGGERIADALGLDIQQIKQTSYDRDIDKSLWVDDGFAPDAPRQTLQWWRERRGLSAQELCMLADVSHSLVGLVEGGQRKFVAPRTRRKFAQALEVAPHKIIFPGEDATPERAQSVEDVLRAELRGAQRTLRRWRDAANDGRYLTNRAYDDLAPLIEDTERELKGT